MAVTAQKVSISLDAKELRWLKALSKKTKGSVSSLVNDAIRLLHAQHERERAQQEFIARLEPEERASAQEMAEIRAEWLRD